MKKTIFTLLSIALIALLSCVSDEGTATVNISFSSADASPAGFVTRDTSYGPGVVPAEVTEIRIGVFAGSVELSNRLLLGIYPADVETATIVVDSGSARIFVVEGRNADGYPIYTGYSSPMSLQAGEIIDLSIAMQKYATATVNINLLQEGPGPAFNLNTMANLLGSQVLVSIVTANSEIFYEDPIVVACNGVGDFYNEYITSAETIDASNSRIEGIEVPANQFLVVVVRGYNDPSGVGYPVAGTDTWISYIGAADPSETSALIPDSVNEITIEMALGVNSTPWTTLGNWKEYTQCADALLLP